MLCSFHDAAWVAEIDYPGNLMCSNTGTKMSKLPHSLGLNYWLKARLLEVTDVGEYASFWLGATTNVSLVFSVL